MQIQYYLANGSEINYQTPYETPTGDDINQCAKLYVEKCINSLPKYVYINVRLYKNVRNTVPIYTHSFNGDTVVEVFLSDVGPLIVKILPMKSDAKLFMIGNEDDFERYDIDKIFENTVLKDCDRV